MKVNSISEESCEKADEQFQLIWLLREMTTFIWTVVKISVNISSETVKEY